MSRSNSVYKNSDTLNFGKGGLFHEPSLSPVMPMYVCNCASMYISKYVCCTGDTIIWARRDDDDDDDDDDVCACVKVRSTKL